MEAAMRHRLDLAEAMLCERAHLSNIDGIRQQVMDEFEIVLTQMPYVGGAASRMSDFFMRLMGSALRIVDAQSDHPWRLRR
jgi:hypothetical protein